MKIPIRVSPTIILGCVAVASGGVAYWAAARYLDQSAASERRRWEQRYAPTATLVAAHDLPAGHTLAAGDLARRDMPVAFLPSRALPATRSAVAVGRRLVSPLRAGDPITENSIDGQRVVALAEQLRAGARAVTVPVDEVSSQAGLVRPGDKIDLMLAEEHNDSGDRCVSVRPLLESVRVLATGRATREGSVSADAGSDRWQGDSYSTITLDVLPEQAQQLAAGQRLGELIPTLRGAGDEAPSGIDSIGSGRGACKPAAPVAAGSAATLKSLPIDIMVGGRQPLRLARHWVAATHDQE
jgi:pilus assembly protein CpaB